jgi:AraC-like DNA-binding protein
VESSATTRGPTAAVGALKALLASAERLGIERAGLLERTGYSDLNLDDKDGRIAIEVIATVDRELRELLGKSSSILLGSDMGVYTVTLVPYILGCSRNLGEYFEHMSRYRQITMEIPAPKLEKDGEDAQFGFTLTADMARDLSCTVDKVVALWVSKARHITGTDWNPLEVHLQSTETDRETYEEFFKAPVHHDSPTNTLRFKSSALDIPTIESDSNLLAFLQPIADSLVSKLETRHQFAHRVQSTLLRLMQRGQYDMDSVATQLAISPRTLQRKLESEGTSFGAILDDSRQRAALEYLSRPEMSISETAFMLGFSEPSTFYRAFRRWTGKTPAQYRRASTT